MSQSIVQKGSHSKEKIHFNSPKLEITQTQACFTPDPHTFLNLSYNSRSTRHWGVPVKVLISVPVLPHVLERVAAREFPGTPSSSGIKKPDPLALGITLLSTVKFNKEQCSCKPARITYALGN